MVGLMSWFHETEEAVSRDFDAITRWYHELGERHMTSLPDEIKTDLTDGLAYVSDWVTRVKSNMPAVVAAAEKDAASPVGKTAIEFAEALGDVVLPPEAMTFVKGMLGYAVATWGAKTDQVTEETPVSPKLQESDSPATPETPVSPLAGGVPL